MNIWYAFRRLRYNKLLSMFIVFAISLMMFLPILIVMAISGYHQYYYSYIPGNPEQTIQFISINSTENLTHEQVKQVNANIQYFSEESRFETIIIFNQHVRKVNIAFQTEEVDNIFNFNYINGQQINTLSKDEAQLNAVVSFDLFKELQQKNIVIKDKTFNIIGTFNNDSNKNTIYISKKNYLQLHSNGVSRYFFKFNQTLSTVELNDFGKKLNTSYFDNKDFKMNTLSEAFVQNQDNTSSILLFSYLIIIIVILYALINLKTVITVKVDSDSYSNRVLYALGIDKRNLFKIMWIQCFILSLIAIVINLCVLPLVINYFNTLTDLYLSFNWFYLSSSILVLASVLSFILACVMYRNTNKS